MFPIRLHGSGGFGYAQGFRPHGDVDPHLWVEPTAWLKYDTPEEVEGMFWHELGHILGLFHETQSNGLRVGGSDVDSIIDVNVPITTNKASAMGTSRRSSLPTRKPTAEPMAT